MCRRAASAASRIMLTKTYRVKSFFVNIIVGLKSYMPVPVLPQGRQGRHAAWAASRNLLI